MRRMLLLVSALVSGLAFPPGAWIGAGTAPAEAATAIGEDPATATPPERDCDTQYCTLVQTGPASAAPADGVVTGFTLRHGRGVAGINPTTVRLVVLTPTGGHDYTLSARSEPVAVGATSDDQVLRSAVRLPIAAGQLVGIAVENAWAGMSSRLATLTAVAAADSIVHQLGQSHASGTHTYSPSPAYRLLLSAQLEPDVDGDGYGDESQDGDNGSGLGGPGGGAGRAQPPGGTPAGPVTPGAGAGTTPGSPVCPTARTQRNTRRAGVLRSGNAPSAVSTRRRTARRTTGKSIWRSTVIDRSDNYNDVAAAFDRTGHLHVAGRGAFHHRVVYWGPHGLRTVESTNDQGSVAIATPRSGPVVGYGTDHTESAAGRLVTCDVFKLATGPGFTPSAEWAHDHNDTAFFFAGLAADPRRRELHAVYETGRSKPQLHHRTLGEAPTHLPLTGGPLRDARIAVRGTTVAVAARTDRHLLVFTRRGKNRKFQRTKIASRAGQFDVALGSDGRARLAYIDRGGRLALYNGRRTVSTRAPMALVAIAAGDGDALHVAAVPTAQSCHTTSVWECRRGGVYHLRTNSAGTRGTVSTVQSTTGFATGRLAIAVRGSKVAIVYGDPANNKQLTVKRRG